MSSSPTRHVEVQFSSGSDSASSGPTVNMREKPNLPNGFVKIRSCVITKENQEASVIVTNKDADGHVVVDAVQFIKK